MTSLNNIMQMDSAPTEVAVSSAIKADLAALARKHVATPDSQWPGTAERHAKDMLSQAIALDLLKDALSSEAIEAIEAVVNFDNARDRALHCRTEYDATEDDMTMRNAIETLQESVFDEVNGYNRPSEASREDDYDW